MSLHYCAITQDTVIEIRGARAGEFLQGQLTCNMRQVQSGQATLGLHCNPAGRVLADIIVAQLDASRFLLVTRAELAPSLRDSLARYAVFSRTEVVLPEPGWRLVGCWHSGTEPPLSDLPSSTSAVIELTGYPDTASKLVLQLRGDAAPAYVTAGIGTDEREWQAREARAGIARLNAGSSGHYVPQALNYDLTGHVSFDKGCYTGQEVVARLHYRGRAKRRLTLWSGPPTLQSIAGLCDAAGGLVATVINQVDLDTQCLLLAVAPLDLESCHLPGAPEPLRRELLPYPLPALD